MGADIRRTSMDGSPDFVRLAEAYGATGYRATTMEEVGPVIEKALIPRVR